MALTERTALEQLKDLKLTENTAKDRQTVEQIVNLVCELPEDELSQSQQGSPVPLEVLIHAAKAILYPSVIHDQIPDFLELLTMIELWRLQAVSNVDKALIFDAYFANPATFNQMPYTQLTEDVKSVLAPFSDDAPTFREYFITIVCHCVATHIKRLYLIGEGSHFHDQWQKYFSVTQKLRRGRRCDRGGLKLPDVDITHIFQYKLAADELNKLVDAMHECIEFKLSTANEAKEWTRKGLPIEEVFKQQDFHDYVGIPALDVEPSILPAIESYLDWVIYLAESQELIPKQLPQP